MEERLRLRDIDDWEIYAKGLEAHIMLMHEQIGAWQRGTLSQPAELDWDQLSKRGDLDQPGVAMVCRLNGEINDILNQAADRASRLRDRAMRLADEELYEERS